MCWCQFSAVHAALSAPRLLTDSFGAMAREIYTTLTDMLLDLFAFLPQYLSFHFLRNASDTCFGVAAPMWMEPRCIPVQVAASHQ